MTSISPPFSQSVLERILEDAHQATFEGERFLAVFDLDSTLFDLTLRVAEIVDSFATDSENRRLFPTACEALAQIRILRSDWGLAEPLARLGLTSESHPELLAALHEHWSYHFFSDRFLHRDQPLPGAVEYVRELHRIGAEIMYLTGRDVPRMLSGTEASLTDWQFPLAPPRARLVLKPTAELHDATFKLEVLREAERHYDRIWLFENEPVNLNLIAQHCPRIGLVFIESTHCGEQTVADELARIEHFEVNLEMFRAYLADRGK